ncbi:hypothetical protein [Thiolapillus sp.]
MALAADVHDEPHAGTDTQLSLDNADTQTDHPVDDSSCHHCAHGISHLLGLSYSDSMIVTGASSISATGHSFAWYSFSPPSLLRPPINT